MDAAHVVIRSAKPARPDVRDLEACLAVQTRQRDGESCFVVPARALAGPVQMQVDQEFEIIH